MPWHRPRIDGEFRGRELPPDVLARWQEKERELDRIETRISRQIAEEEAACR